MFKNHAQFYYFIRMKQRIKVSFIHTSWLFITGKLLATGQMIYSNGTPYSLDYRILKR